MDNHGDGATMMEIMPVMHGDHVGALEMEIKGTRRKAISYHNYELHVMLILLCTLFVMLRCDRDGSMIR